MLYIEDDRHIIKDKGPAKDFVTSEWFVRQLADLSRTEQIPTSANFRINWSQLKIVKKEFMIKLGLPQSTKRDNIYDDQNVWIDTRPKEVIDFGTKDATTIYKYELMRINEEMAKKEQMMNDKKVKLYSYFLDLRFLIAVCAIIGFSAWWGLAPEPLLAKPEAICAPDLQLVYQVIKDILTDRLCSYDHVISPCECGEPLKKAARDEPAFDPLGIKKTGQIKAFSVFLASFFLSFIALAESVSQNGVRFDL